MDVRINSVHFDASQQLQEFVNEKVSKLIKKHEEITSAEVFLRLQKSDTTENKIAEVKLLVPRQELFARKQAKTFEEATDLTIEAMKRQLKKYKEQTKEK